MRIAACATFVLGICGVALRAHGGAAPLSDDPRVFSGWDQATLAGLVLMAALYWRGCGNATEERGLHRRLEHAAFTGGCLALATAVLPWFDRAVITRFSAHMAQHELMMLVGAPLLVAGRPLATCLRGLPVPWRRLVALPFRGGLRLRVFHLLTAPVTAWAAHGTVLWVWHLPALYDRAVQSEPLHALQHAMFVGTSLLFWQGLVYGRYGRAGYGAAVFFVFTTAVHTGILGALFALSRTPA
jgi:putative membrane protein